jgi:hypothetical protein
VWQRGVHAHCHPSEPFLVFDHVVGKCRRGGPTEVWFLNRRTGKEIRIAANPAMEDYIGSSYHIDPHPRFCAQGRYVVFTVTVNGHLDLAIVPTADLIDRTS